MAQALQKRVKSLGNQVINLEARNKHLTEVLAATKLAPPKLVPQEDGILATMDAKVAKINARVSAVV